MKINKITVFSAICGLGFKQKVDKLLNKKMFYGKKYHVFETLGNLAVSTIIIEKKIKTRITNLRSRIRNLQHTCPKWYL